MDDNLPGRPVQRRDVLRTIGMGVLAGGLLKLTPAQAHESDGEQPLPTGDGVTQALDPPGGPEVIGQWTAPMPGPFPVIGVHAILLHTNEVLILANTNAYVWNPGTGSAAQVNPPNNLFCCGHAVLGDGDVLFSGGFVQGSVGPRWLYTFRPATRTWTRRPDMREGRYYPTVIALPGGGALITGGKDGGGSLINPDVEYYANGRVTVVGTRALSIYPAEFVLPNNKVLAVSDAGTVHLLDRASWKWTAQPPTIARHTYPSAALLPGGPAGSYEVMILAGSQGLSPTATAERFDASNPARGWRLAAPLPQPRAHMNTVILPDGTLLGVGGLNSDGPQRAAILYDPVANTWQTLAAQTEERGYHSSAVLLPGGKVLSAGDNVAPGGGDKLEVFSPPYLFRGPRPTITSAPLSVTLGRAFSVGTQGDVARAVLIRPGATTHSMNMNQRHVELRFTKRVGGITVTPPTSSSVAPLGYYLLFVLSGDGVPSFGRWVKVILPL